MLSEYMRQSLVDAVVSVIQHKVAGDERGVDRVRNEHVYRAVADKHLCDSRHVSNQYYQHEYEAFALPCAADP